jgi:hypothetical protein
MGWGGRSFKGRYGLGMGWGEVLVCQQVDLGWGQVLRSVWVGMGWGEVVVDQ